MANNHVIDPTYFNDAIAMFGFNYEWYPCTSVTVDEYGKNKYTYTKKTLYGSIQSRGCRLNQSTTGNTEQHEYELYCSSMYRIKTGDFMYYKKKGLYVNFVQDYDEWGVRSASLTMTNLNNHRDFKEYRKYLDGGEIV